MPMDIEAWSSVFPLIFLVNFSTGIRWMKLGFWIKVYLVRELYGTIYVVFCTF
jgi:hypothetical protein